ncbi:MAG: aminomethyl-transferring glycine dehydrogenase subunit GcvPB [Candidatus Omnitrophica bacterium]|nr:aminomethyl-transferring glycine dehydrogenase subunit GcvPB [Candidatus Omnitrophota bacterium]
MKLIFEKSIPERPGFQVPRSDVGKKVKIDKKYTRSESASLPEVSELDCVRHFTQLSQRNYSVDTHFYPLGSCTMKYNPRFTENIANIRGFACLHPLLAQLPNGDHLTQGALQILYETEQSLCEITGMDNYTMQPLAGAHGELTGVMMMAAYHKSKGNKKKYIIIPDSAHGTNPASAAIAGYTTISIPSNAEGVMDIDKLKEKLTGDAAGLMLTNPNTHGIFNNQISEIAELVHAVDGLMYYDGANLNAILGRCRPGDMGFDIVHLNLHKTFATPHGGGGPGAGPVGVKKELSPFLPISRVGKKGDGSYYLNYDYPQSIGYIAAFYGNFSIIVRAYAYIMLLGQQGLQEVGDHAVLNANYIKERLKKYFKLKYDRTCMHEVVFSAAPEAQKGVHAIDIAKYLIDKGFHPPTVYFPLTVKEAIMIEPTETESKQAIDGFIEAMIEAHDLIKKKPEVFKEFPQSTPISRPDEVKAARELNANYFNKKL